MENLARAFAALGYAIKWWYKGPGQSCHAFSPQVSYVQNRKYCKQLVGCVRCSMATLCREDFITEEHKKELITIVNQGQTEEKSRYMDYYPYGVHYEVT